jgi:hypothetical protein
LAENERSEERQNEIPLRVWWFQEKESLEKVLKETGEDMIQKQVDYFIRHIIDDKTQIYSRRREIMGAGMIYTQDLKFADLLDEAVRAYTLGMYNSSISLSCIAAERFLYDFIDIADITLNSRILSNEAKSYLYYIPIARLGEFFEDLNVIDHESRTLLAKINDMRNRYVHPKMKDHQNLKKESLEALNLMCELAKRRLSILNFYDVVDGKLVRKPEYA